MNTVAAVRQAIESHVGEMTPTLAKVAAWMTRNTTEIAWTRVEDVAKQVGVSTATVIRASKRSGFRGYADLQRIVREQLPKSSPVWKMLEEAPQHDRGTLLGTVVAEEKANLDLLEGLVAPAFDALVDVLLAARRIVVVASLLTAPLADYLAQQLQWLLGEAESVDAATSHAWLVFRSMQEQDCVIGLSYPRYAAATHRFLARSLERTPQVMLLTDQAGPELQGGRCTVRLPVRSHSHYSSNAGLMALIQALARALAQRNPERVLGNLDAVDTLWRELKLLRSP